MAALEQALAKEECEKIRTIGHRIKGLAGSYGLDEIGAIGGALEQAALARDLDSVREQIVRLTDALRHARPAIEDRPDYGHRAA